MAYNKVDIVLSMSAETATRFSAITDTMSLTNEQALSYLLDLHDKMKPERDGFPEKRPLESRLHTCVQTEIKTKFRQLATEYGLNFDQMLSVLIDVYDQCPERAAGQTPEHACAEAAKPEDAGDAKDAAGNAMAQLETALDMIRSAFLSLSSEGSEVTSLREQLALSQAETRKAEETYRRKLQAIAA